MSPKRLARLRGSSRFAAGVIGAVVASLVWLVVVMVISMSPDQAAQRRAAPELPPPTVALKTTELRQVTWAPCSRDTTSISIAAPAVPAGERSVVTAVAAAGAKVTTGTQLARVASRPLVAVHTDAVLYRDLTVGATGPDVAAFEKALHQAGVIGKANSVLDADTVHAWHHTYDPAGPSNRIRVATLVAVPADTEVSSVMVTVGQAVKPGTPLLELSAGSNQLRCEVLNPSGSITPADVTLDVAGKTVPAASLTVHPRTDDEPGYVLVKPKDEVADGAAVRLGIVSASSDGPVLVAPLSAITTSSNGAPSVVVVDGDVRREVPVQLGVTAQGLVAVSGDGLADGVQVMLFGAADETAGPTGRGTAPPQSSVPDPGETTPGRDVSSPSGPGTGK